MKTGGVIFRFILGLLLACGAMAALLYFSLPLDGDFLSGVFEEGPAGKLMEKTQDIWGGVLIGMNLVALAGLLLCPKKGVPIFSAICGGLLLWALLVILGLVVDPTTEGVRDSARAMKYDEPYPYTPEEAEE